MRQSIYSQSTPTNLTPIHQSSFKNIRSGSSFGIKRQQTIFKKSSDFFKKSGSVPAQKRGTYMNENDKMKTSGGLNEVQEISSSFSSKESAFSSSISSESINNKTQKTGNFPQISTNKELVPLKISSSDIMKFGSQIKRQVSQLEFRSSSQSLNSKSIKSKSPSKSTITNKQPLDQMLPKSPANPAPDISLTNTKKKAKLVKTKSQMDSPTQKISGLTRMKTLFGKSLPTENKKPRKLKRGYSDDSLGRSNQHKKVVFKEKENSKSYELSKSKRQSKVQENEGQNNQIFVDFENSLHLEKGAAQRFLQYKDHFVNLTKRNFVKTKFDVLSIIITHDETTAIAVLQRQVEIFVIQSYDLKTASIIQKFEIQGEIIKAIEVVQDLSGQTFCLPYFDTGNFKIRIFNKINDSIDHIQDINDRLNILSVAQLSQRKTYPSINAVFCRKNVIFVNLFEQKSTTNYHFLYDFREQKLVGEYQKTQMNCSPQNFPMNCFLNEEDNNIYVIYRHGQFLTFYEEEKEGQIKKSDSNNILMNNNSSTILKKNPFTDLKQASIITEQVATEYNQVRIQQLVSSGLGQMHLFQNCILIARHSNDILFFKESNINEKSKYLIHTNNRSRNTHAKYWKLYHTMHQQGQIFHSKGQEKLTLTTELKIYFFKFNQQTWIPELESVIFNFMGCNKLIIGPNDLYMISHQVSQEDFVIYQRKYHHMFMVQLDKQIRITCNGLHLNKADAYCICDDKRITLYNTDQFKPFNYIQVIEEVDESKQKIKASRKYDFRFLDEHEDIRILNLKASEDESSLVVIIGQKKQNQTCKVHQINVYSLNKNHLQIIQDIKPKYKNKLDKSMIDISAQFEFCNEAKSSKIYLIDSQCIYKYDYTQNEFNIFLHFRHELFTQPDFIVMNYDQNIAFIACEQFDALFIDINTQNEVYFDHLVNVKEIQACIFHNSKFYILANRIDRQRGIYLIEVDENDIEQNTFTKDKVKYIYKHPNYLNISDADINILGNQSDGSVDSSLLSFGEQDQQLVVSYKSIYVNTYTVIVLNVNNESDNQYCASSRIVFLHESLHIWESQVRGYLLSSHDFIILTQDGIKILSLARSSFKKTIEDCNQNLVVLHSLQECMYLKIAESNHLMMTYSLDQSETKIQILDSFEAKKKKQKAEKMEIYTIIIEQVDLKELLLLQGLFSCSSQSQIAILIEEQPDPKVFMKSLLEMDLTNMISILSFDSRSIKALLNSKHSHTFRKEYPIFYKFKHCSEDIHNTYEEATLDKFKTAIDVALDNNQTQGLSYMLEYIVQYQNSYHHSYLFQRTFVFLLIKDINVVPLLNSNIMYQSFDYDDWPQTHTEDNKQIMQFNGSIFKLGQHYQEIFPVLAADEPNQEIARRSVNERVHKIIYSINLLPSMHNDEISLMSILSSTTQIEIFNTKAVQNLIEFKWNNYAKVFHYIFAFVHMIYLTTFIVYINTVYINRDFEKQKLEIYIMVFCNCTATIYDITQLYRIGLSEYYGDIWNYVDVLHIYGGFYNLYTQYNSDSNELIERHKAKVFMILATLMMLVKTFFFLRIFKSLSQFVIMVMKVCVDLREFLFFYILFLSMFSIILAVLGVGNKIVNDDNQDQASLPKNISGLHRQIPPLLNNFLHIFRYSLADFDFGVLETNEFGKFETQMFWATWVIIVLITNIVFLNFVISEVANSYNEVQSFVHQLIAQERTSLIQECEEMLDEKLTSDNQRFPKYLILREREE